MSIWGSLQLRMAEKRTMLTVIGSRIDFNAFHVGSSKRLLRKLH